MSLPICYQGIPTGHPFEAFLERLPVDKNCDPHPDFVEPGNATRLMIAFASINASARLNMFAHLLKKNCPSVQVVSTSIKKNSACCIVFLFQTSTLDETGHIIRFPVQPQLQLMGPRPQIQVDGEIIEIEAHTPTENKVPAKDLPGVKMMPSY